jgi:hypothetical protein
VIDFQILKRITQDTFQSINRDSDGEHIKSKLSRFSLWLFFIIIPLGLSTTAYVFKVDLRDIESVTGTIIAIFTGLFFSLLLSIGTKIREERGSTDLEINQFHRFKNNLKQISHITLFTIICGTLILGLMLLNSMVMGICINEFNRILTFITVYFISIFLIMLLLLVQRFHHVLKDEIDNIL